MQPIGSPGQRRPGVSGAGGRALLWGDAPSATHFAERTGASPKDANNPPGATAAAAVPVSLWEPDPRTRRARPVRWRPDSSSLPPPTVPPPAAAADFPGRRQTVAPPRP